MPVKYYIGFDCGTLGTKVGIFTGTGETVAQAYREHIICYPKPSWAEMEAEQFYKVVSEGIHECLSKGKVDPKRVCGISCSGIVCGFVPIDKDWKPVGAYICYLDGRAKKEAEQLQKIPNPPWVKESGNAEPGAYMPPVILKWILNHQPDVAGKMKKVVAAGPYVIGKLGGFKAKDAYIDWAHLSGWVIGFDARKHNWSERQIETLGLPFEVLPRVVKPWQVVGELSREQASLLGLRPGIPLVAGAGDIMQSCLGSGLTEAGMVCDVAGTASIFVFAMNDLNENITKTKVLVNSMSTLEDLYLLWGFIPAGGFSLRWYRDEVFMKKGDESAYDKLNKFAENVSPGSDFTFFFPFLQGRSSPVWPEASGAWVGVKGSNQAGHFWRSIMEGIAFEYLLWTEVLRGQGISTKRVIGSGGGTKSRLWNQIKSDMLNSEYVVTERSEGAILGNALLAAYGVGDIKNLKQTAKEWVKVKETFKPRKKMVEFYKKLAEIRGEILNGPLRECFNKLTLLDDIQTPRG